MLELMLKISFAVPLHPFKYGFVTIISAVIPQLSHSSENVD
jgi:hypothetical protein